MSKRTLIPLIFLVVLAACTPPAPPAIQATVSPADGAVDVAVDSVVSATFNVAINESTLSGAFTLSSEAGEVAGVLSYDAASRTATFTPSADLAYGTEYTAAVAGTLRSTAGGRLPIPVSGSYSWSFTTGAEPDEPEPEPDPAVLSVVVSPAVAAALVGDSQQFTAAVTAVGGADESLTWSSSDDAIATVDASGLVTALAEGNATITATSVFDAAVSGSASFTVATAPAVVAVVVDPATAELELGGSVQLTAEVVAVGGADESLGWSSSDEAVATVDASGLVTAVAGGAATITATSVFNPAASSSAEVAVLAPAVLSVVVTPESVTIEGGLSQQLLAEVSTVSGADASLNWTSSDEAVATVDADGLVTAVARGTATITATSVFDAGVSGAATAIVVQPDAFSFPAVGDAGLGAVVTSADTTLSGLTAPATATLSGSGAVLLVNGVGVGTSAQVQTGDSIAIQLTASGAYSTTVSATVTIAGVSGTFSVTTLGSTPVITAFSSEPGAVQAGSTILLQWAVNSVADQITISNDRGLPVIDGSGATSATVTVPANRPTITFTLTATNTATSESDSEVLSLDLGLWVCTDDTDPITITDPTLEAVIRGQLALGPAAAIQCSGMQSLTTINTGHYDGNPGDIASLEGLQHASNLIHLDAQHNEISDAEPIANLLSLEVINFDRNEIVDLEPFRNLANLYELGLWDNGPVDDSGDDGFDDLEPLSGLVNLRTLYMSSNNISDLSPLSALVNLELLWVMNNRILDLGPVANLTALRSFRVGWNQGGPETGFARITDISALDGLPELAWLGLEWAAVADTAALATLPSLYAISLEGNRLTSVGSLVANADFPLIPTTPLPFAPADPTLNVVENCLDTTPLSADALDIDDLEGRGVVVIGFTAGQQELCPAGGGFGRSFGAQDLLRELSLQQRMQRNDFR